MSGNVETNTQRGREHTPTPWHTDRYHMYIWGPQEQMVADSRIDDAKAECPEESGEPTLRARGVGGRLPINENMDFIIEAVNSHAYLSNRVKALEHELAEERVLNVLSSRDVPGFEACVKAEIENIRTLLTPGEKP